MVINFDSYVSMCVCMKQKVQNSKPYKSPYTTDSQPLTILLLPANAASSKFVLFAIAYI